MRMEEEEDSEWWQPDQFEVLDSQSKSALRLVRERLLKNSQLRAQYTKARSRSSSRLFDVVEIPLVLKPKKDGSLDEAEVVLIGDVVNWPQGTAAKILVGELSVVTATFKVQKRSREKKVYGRSRCHNKMQLTIIQSDSIGERPVMEDRYLIHLFNDIAVFGVFDGHSGTAAADVVCSRLIPALRGQFKKKFESGIRFSFTNSNPQPPDAIEEETMAAMQDCLHEAVKEVEQEAIVHLSAHLDYSGCTLCVCLCTRSTLLVANLGDSRVVMSRKGGKMQQVTKKDHVAKDDKERQRIEESGGFVNAEGYLGGKVQVSRAIGDIDSDTGNKIVGLSSDPDLSKFPLDIESDEFIIMACDGLWEVFSLQGAVNFVREALKRTKGDLSKATDELVKKAIELKTTDNVTVIIAYLPKVENIWMKDISSRTPTPDDDERPRLFKKKPNVSV